MWVIHVIDDDLPSAIANVQETAAYQSIHDTLAKIEGGLSDHIKIEIVVGKADRSMLIMAEKP